MLPAPELLAILSFPDIDPVVISLGPLSVHWYGLAYVAGILLGWLYARRLSRAPQLWAGGSSPVTPAHLDDFIVWAAIGIVIGGRTGYVLFYDLVAVLAEPLRALRIDKGGMSFHSGLAGTTLAMILFARRNKIPVWSMFDIVATITPIGIFFGRIANFINGELWGRLSEMPWAVVFCNERLAQPYGYCPAGDFARHPSQLYEAGLEGIVLFLFLRLLTHGFKALKSPGLVTGAFVSFYALARIFVEFFREPDKQIGYLAGNWLTMGMVLSLPMLVLGLWAVLRARRASASGLAQE